MSSQALMAKISLPYAEALVALAQNTNTLEKINEDVSMVRQILGESDNLNIFLTNPLLSQASKKEVIKQLFSGQVSDTLLTFLFVLVDKKRIAYLDVVLDKYLELVCALESLTIASVISTSYFSDEQQEKLIEKLKSMTGSKKVKLEISVNPKLIGGFIVQVGSKVIDTSLHGQLEEIGYFLQVGQV
jgi:F-type H+-transporting ATPase subunit delta